jgi:hypothetical protein
MAAYIGKIEAFDRTIEPWSSYVERLAQYFKAQILTLNFHTNIVLLNLLMR